MRDAAALGQQRLVLALGDEVLDLLGLVVVDLEALGLHRLEVADLRLGLELHLLARSELVARRDPDHVAVLALVQPLGLQDDVERLVPGHVLQAQCQVALHRVGRDDVEVGEVGDDLQHRAHVDVLEVQRQLLALVLPTAALYQLVGVLDDALDLEHELVVALVGVVLPHAVGRHHQAGILALLLGHHRSNRRGEVGDVRAAAQVLRQRSLEELDDQVAALLADVDTGVRARQVDHDTTFAILAAAEVDVADIAAVNRCGTRFGEIAVRLADRGDRRCARTGRRNGDDQIAPVDARFVRADLHQVQHQARAVAGLHDVGAAQVALLDALQRAAQTVAGGGEVERDAGRVGHAETRRHRGERLLETELDVERTALLGDLERFDLVGQRLRLLCNLLRASRLSRRKCDT